MRWQVWENEDGSKILRVRDNGRMWFPVGPVSDLDEALEKIREISGEEPKVLRVFSIVK